MCASVSSDIDECAEGLIECHNHSRCVNLPGWYHCECRSGFHDNGSYLLDGSSCIGEHTLNSKHAGNTSSSSSAFPPPPIDCFLPVCLIMITWSLDNGNSINNYNPIILFWNMPVCIRSAFTVGTLGIVSCLLFKQKFKCITFTWVYLSIYLSISTVLVLLLKVEIDMLVLWLQRSIGNMITDYSQQPGYCPEHFW